MGPALHSHAESVLGAPFIFASPCMWELARTVQQVAQSKAAALITGESGSGKELVARALHQHSLRCNNPWIDVNCGALPDHLVESELFGYEKGAFSGADSAKQGLFELAHTGTLFLDEIGELDPRTQVKLLRVLDGAPYYRLGGVRKVSVDVRVVTATSRDLEEVMQRGGFRRELFYRLSQIRIKVPPLRERPEDIRLLAAFFLEEVAPTSTFLPATLEALEQYHWPGNVRELKNAVVAAGILASGREITLADLPPEIGARMLTPPLASPTRLKEMERQMILQALMETGGSSQRAASILGISKKTISRKLKSYGIDEVCGMAA
jgi:DNA-binding NtrC family response regulator